MSHNQPTIEELLEHIGSQEPIGDHTHRYELRRSLLCSRLFEDACASQSRWDRVMSYSAPFMVATMMMSVFAFMLVYAPVEPEIGHQTSPVGSSVVHVPAAEVVVEVAPLRAEDFLSDPDEPTVSLAEFGFVDSQSSLQVVPVSIHSVIQTQ